MNDIRDHGVRIPIVLYEGKILDGRNRVAAAKRAGQTKIIYTGFEGSFEQARDFVISMNLARRHLDTGQRAMIASELASMKQGARTDLVQNCTMSVPDAAKASVPDAAKALQKQQQPSARPIRLWQMMSSKERSSWPKLPRSLRRRYRRRAKRSLAALKSSAITNG
jgi:hypothetical protein